MGRRPKGATPRLSVLLLTSLCHAAFACDSFIDALFFAGRQGKEVALDFHNEILLHLAIKTTQHVLEGFGLLKSDFRQLTTPPNSSRWTG